MIAKAVVALVLGIDLTINIYYTVKHILSDSYVCFSDRELALQHYLSTLINILLLALVLFWW